MVIIQVCVGSSCHLKGSEEIVEALTEEIRQNHLEDEIVMAGSFCAGRCNRNGVTIQVDDDIYDGVSKEDLKTFFVNNIMSRVKKADGNVNE